jgi:dipeptidyl aminopeptidase/acylaminoacyl peptidase
MIGAPQKSSLKDRNWISPDGALIALARNFNHPEDSAYNDWDILTVQDRAHKSRASLSLEEGSGVNRAVVTEALWSPDSRFLVFQTESSGGHSSWHTPTYVYDTKTSRIYSIDDMIGAITSDNSPLHFTTLWRKRRSQSTQSVTPNCDLGLASKVWAD